MSSLPVQVATVTALFAGTNVDDMVIISLLSASAQAGRPPKHWQIWAGQYVGFGVLIGGALLPAYWLCWRDSEGGTLHTSRTVLTVMLAVIVWWNFLVGHVLNNILSLG